MEIWFIWLMRKIKDKKKINAFKKNTKMPFSEVLVNFVKS